LGGRVGPQEEEDGAHHVVELHHLQRSRLGDERQDRQAGKPAKQRAAAVGRPSDDDRRPQNHPGEVVTHERLIAGPLGARESRGCTAVGADRGNLHDAPHAGLLAGREQGGRAIGVHAGRGIAQTVLQYAGAIDNRIDTRQVRQPGRGIVSTGDVEGDALFRPGQSVRVAGVVHHGDDLVAGATQAGKNGRADETRRARQQHAQGALPLQVRGVLTTLVLPSPPYARKLRARSRWIEHLDAAQVDPSARP
jgi:hypothetical protein